MILVSIADLEVSIFLASLIGGGLAAVVSLMLGYAMLLSSVESKVSARFRETMDLMNTRVETLLKMVEENEDEIERQRGVVAAMQRQIEDQSDRIAAQEIEIQSYRERESRYRRVMRFLLEHLGKHDEAAVAQLRRENPDLDIFSID